MPNNDNLKSTGCGNQKTNLLKQNLEEYYFRILGINTQVAKHGYDILLSKYL